MARQSRRVYLTGDANTDQILNNLADRLDALEGLRPTLGVGYLFIKETKEVIVSLDPLLAEEVSGTANQIIVTINAGETIAISTPQDINTDADVVFDTLILDSIKILLLSANSIPYIDSDGSLIEANPGLTFDGTHLSIGQDNAKIYQGLANDMSIFYDGVDGNIKTDEVAASDLLLTCGAEKTLELQNVVYEDLQVSISNIRIPPSNAPTERLYNHGIVGGVTFPVLGFGVNEYFYFDVQTQHAMKLNTILDNHIHFMTPTDGSGTPDRFQFQLDVIAAGIEGNWAVPTGSPFTEEHIISADYTNKHKLMELADIPASNTTVSSIYSCKLTRIAATQDEYGSEVYLKFNDCHFQANTMGSRQEDSK